MKKEDVGIGRRKTAVASVRLRKGKGLVTINGKEHTKFFSLESQQTTAVAPLAILDLSGSYDVVVRVKGGGMTGQTEAVRLGIARALVKLNEDFRPKLKEAGFLTRDSREKERKKYGKAKARKSFQFSKR